MIRTCKDINNAFPENIAILDSYTVYMKTTFQLKTFFQENSFFWNMIMLHSFWYGKRPGFRNKTMFVALILKSGGYSAVLLKLTKTFDIIVHGIF